MNTGDIKDFLRMIHICGLGLKFVDFGMLVPDGAEFKVVKVKEEDGKVELKKRGEKRGVWGKVMGSVELWFFTNRGVGWNWEVGGIPECPNESRRFVSLFQSHSSLTNTEHSSSVPLSV